MNAPPCQTLGLPNASVLADEAARGLLQARASLSPKFLYDPLGSRLFEAITALDEYYLTRIETEILTEYRQEMGEAIDGIMPRLDALVDLGAGNCAKAAAWFEVLNPTRYLAVDISTEFLRASIEPWARRYPAIAMSAMAMDFSTRLVFATGELPDACLFHYPGSSIGNFAPADALRLLTQMRSAAPRGAALIGVDLVKPESVLIPAYDDALGVTAAFNLNLLRHLNRLLGTQFDPREWRHVARYSQEHQRIEMHLEARHALELTWPGQSRRFEAGEGIHTENSYKWTTDGFGALLHQAGYSQVRHWCDARGWFAVFLASC
jgi:L-histidine N-alpha-methyltransferase